MAEKSLKSPPLQTLRGCAILYKNPNFGGFPMETRKLFYEDCHLSHFSARVLSCAKGEKGWEVILDATAFYPEGGGQACDVGTLGAVRVLDVRERGEEVVHFCDGPLPVGEGVEGSIDFDRRFHLMQQHTGEHIVSGIINRRYGYHNTGFHIGAQGMVIDFDGVIPLEEILTIEAEANAFVWANLPLRCWYPSPEALSQVVYRTKRALPWPVRIVEIPGVDRCACCGVHVASTGEVGIVKIFTAMGFRGGTRMEMACGGQAFGMLNAAFDQNRQVSQAFSAQWQETGAAARRMNETLEGEKAKSAALWKRIFAGIAKDYVNCGNVLHFEPGLESVQLRDLADAIGGCCGGVAAVFSGSDEAGYGYAMVARQGDIRPFGREMTGKLQGRGGGKPNFQQGRVSATQAQIGAFFRESWDRL